MQASTPRSIQDLEKLLQHEQELLSQLQEIQFGTGGLMDAVDLGVATIDPRTDPLAVFKQHLTQVQGKPVVSSTAEELAAFFSSTVMEASLQLHLLQTGEPGMRATGAARLEALWQRYLHTLMSLMISKQIIVLERVIMTNLDTWLLDEDADAKRAALLADVPRALGLTEQQLREIRAGTTLFEGLLGKLLQEQHQHQQELARQGSWASRSSSGSSGSFDNSRCLPDSDSEPSTLHQLHRDLAGHQRSTGRMQALLHKDYCMRGAAVAWLFGCLSWEQVTKALVMCWPWILRPLQLARAITLYAKECKLK